MRLRSPWWAALSWRCSCPVLTCWSAPLVYSYLSSTCPAKLRTCRNPVQFLEAPSRCARCPCISAEVKQRSKLRAAYARASFKPKYKLFYFLCSCHHRGSDKLPLTDMHGKDLLASRYKQSGTCLTRRFWAHVRRAASRLG